jgi:hypothetical protein
MSSDSTNGREGNMLDDSDANSLDRAVDLASWLIRTRRRPPGRAVQIAAHKHGVDRHLVAERVGQRGGRRAAAVRRDERERAPTPAILPAALSIPGPPPAANTVTLVVASVEYTATEIRLSVYPTTGPLCWRPLAYLLPPGWLPPVSPDDIVECVGEYRPDSDGGPILYLTQFVRIEAARPGAQSR